MSIETPVQWLKGLGDLLLDTRCKVEGEGVSLDDAYKTIADIFINLREREGTLWWVGNGGSASICTHLSQDVLNKLQLRSMHFCDPSLITCMANDFGYAESFRKPLSMQAKAGDALIAISSSGNSDNIIACGKQAAEMGMELITLSAFEETNKLYNLPAEVSMYLPTSLYGLAEVGHEALIHAAIECVWLQENQN